MAKPQSASALDPAKPLAGRRIVCTRARTQAGALARRIEDLGGEVFDFPTIAVEPPDDFAAFDGAIGAIENYHWLIFTSVNGVAPFLDRLRLLNKPVSCLARVPSDCLVSGHSIPTGGMRWAAQTYDVPVVGGHLTRSDGPPALSTAVRSSSRDKLENVDSAMVNSEKFTSRSVTATFVSASILIVPRAGADAPLARYDTAAYSVMCLC
jgi:hypothetical protein